jgi:tyrosinase
MAGQCDLGQMTDPRCAALDPIFWLHHANIDRLWNRWIALGGGRANPSDAAWLNQGFQFNLPTGAATTMTPAGVVDSANQLQYVYDDLPAPVTPVMSPTPTPPQPPQLGGASDVPVELSGQTASVQISVPQDLVGMVNDAAGGTGSMILNVEDIAGDVDPGMVYEVYLEVQSPSGGEPRREFIGNVTFFGLPNQTATDADHTEPPGLRHSFDITGTVNALAAAGDWDPANLRVVFEPVTSSLPEGVDSLVAADDVVVPPVSVGRVSIFIE